MIGTRPLSRFRFNRATGKMFLLTTRLHASHAYHPAVPLPQDNPQPPIPKAPVLIKYLNHIKNHIRPAFGHLMMADLTTGLIDEWLAAKARAKLSWATRIDLRNLLSGIFTQAGKWGLWREKNPALHVSVGRKRPVRDKRKLTEEETRRVLKALPEDVRLICMMALFCTLRISEVLGLQWKHIDWARGLILAPQRDARRSRRYRLKLESRRP